MFYKTNWYLWLSPHILNIKASKHRHGMDNQTALVTSLTSSVALMQVVRMHLNTFSWRLSNLGWLLLYNVQNCILSNKLFSSSSSSAAYMLRWTGLWMVSMMAWCLAGIKPLPKLMMSYQSHSMEQASIKISSPLIYIDAIAATLLSVISPPIGPGREEFNSLRDACMRQYTNHHWFRSWLVARSVPSHYLLLVEIMACRLVDTKPLSEPLRGYC